jgi:hypothetical protein
MDYVIVFVEGHLGLGRTINVGPNLEDGLGMLEAILKDRCEGLSKEEIRDAVLQGYSITLKGGSYVEIGQLEVASYV